MMFGILWGADDEAFQVWRLRLDEIFMKNLGGSKIDEVGAGVYESALRRYHARGYSPEQVWEKWYTDSGARFIDREHGREIKPEPSGFLGANT